MLQLILPASQDKTSYIQVYSIDNFYQSPISCILALDVDMACICNIEYDVLKNQF